VEKLITHNHSPEPHLGPEVIAAQLWAEQLMTAWLRGRQPQLQFFPAQYPQFRALQVRLPPTVGREVWRPSALGPKPPQLWKHNWLMAGRDPSQELIPLCDAKQPVHRVSQLNSGCVALGAFLLPCPGRGWGGGGGKDYYVQPSSTLGN
jgi:hypothetical protein